MDDVIKPTGRIALPLHRDWMKWVLPTLAFLAIILVFHALSDGVFLTPRNLSNLSRQVCVNLTLALGMTFVILTAGIDLSVGSVLALCGMTAAISQVHWGFSDGGAMGALGSVGLALSVGLACGALTGSLVSHFKITPFIVTLGMMVICRGMTLIISDARAVAPIGSHLSMLSDSYLSPLWSSMVIAGAFLVCMVVILKGKPSFAEMLKKASVTLLFVGSSFYIFCGYRGIPYMVFLTLMLTFLAVVVLRYSRYGRFVMAIGGNAEAARLSGVPVQKTLFITYLIMGGLAAVAGILDSTRVNGAVPSAGELGELDAIAAVVIGGTSLMGGVGSILGTMFGVLVMGVLNNGLSLVGVSEHYQKVFKGVVIVLAVYLDLKSKSRTKKA